MLKKWWRSRVKELERRVKRLEEAAKDRELPALYNKYAEFADPVPLGQVSTRCFTSLQRAGMHDIINAAQDVLDNKDAAHNFTLWLETTEGVFVRTIERDAKISMDVEDDARTFQLNAHWSPISAGRSLSILDSAITYNDRLMNRIDRVHGLRLCKGDELRIEYTFKN